jgi:protein-L-isoaspartate(D-aspartate) O-methyltransferase
MSDLEAVRAWYAEELRYVAGVKSRDIVRAFATVPRERFLGPGPWLINNATVREPFWPTDDDDPRRLYHNILVAIIPEQRLNNGLPSLWACLYDQLDLAPGKRVLHLGCGTGYYSAVLAEIVGPTGQVTAVDVEEALVARAREALASWPQAAAIAADGSSYTPGPVDTIIVNAGATHPLPLWLDALSPAGQLLLPLTGEQGWGQTLLVTRRSEGGGFAARFAGYVGIYHFAGARDAAMAQRLDAAFKGGGMEAVKSLRREAHAEDESCWLHGEGWCLSRREATQ